ncbi:MAG: hypothetical protein A2Z03_04415 [Chloroflexi bacterium RBG_16_56_8]|nr:MAG: hypothetical protein A2Z03_04415 [Chloroflexi bacterium RBG_16_56_8]
MSVLVRADNKIALVGEADDLASGQPMVAERAPALVVLNVGEGGDTALMGLRQIKAQYPQVHFVALVRDREQERRARMAGADAVLVEGFTSETLSKMMNALMATPSMHS